MVRRHRDLKKRKREEPVAQGTLFIRDLGFLGGKKEEEEEEGLEKKFIEWRKVLVEKMNGIEVNLEGVKYNLSVVLPVSDDFERLKKDWEEFYAFGNYLRGFFFDFVLLESVLIFFYFFLVLKGIQGKEGERRIR